MSETVIELNKIGKVIRTGFWGRKVTLLSDVTMRVRKGCVYGFVGPNGAGKSTTIKLLLGAARPTSGTLSVLGASPYEHRTKARVGYLPELPALPGTLSGRELLRLHAKLAGVDGDKIERRIDELFEQVDLERRGEQRIKTFSKGMQQRLLLASALLADPELLILDEPMSGLDPLGRRLVREVIAGRRRAGKTVFFSSHVLSDVEALSDDVALIVAGAVRRSGPLNELLERRGAGWEILFEARGNELPAEARALGKIEERGHAASLRIPADADPFAPARVLADAGCNVLSVDQLRGTLEDELNQLVEVDRPAGGDDPIDHEREAAQ